MVGDLTHESEGELLETFTRPQVCPRLTEYVQTEQGWINQELKRRAEATERRFGIDMVPESDE